MLEKLKKVEWGNVLAGTMIVLFLLLLAGIAGGIEAGTIMK